MLLDKTHNVHFALTFASVKMYKESALIIVLFQLVTGSRLPHFHGWESQHQSENRLKFELQHHHRHLVIEWPTYLVMSFKRSQSHTYDEEDRARGYHEYFKKCSEGSNALCIAGNDTKALFFDTDFQVLTALHSSHTRKRDGHFKHERLYFHKEDEKTGHIGTNPNHEEIKYLTCEANSIKCYLTSTPTTHFKIIDV